MSDNTRFSSFLVENSNVLKHIFSEEVYSFPEDNSAKKDTKKIEKEDIESVSPTTLKPNIEYMGENNKYILLLVGVDLFSDAQKENLNLLNKILAAKQWELRDVALVNLSKCSNVDFFALKSFFACTRILGFGLKSSDIGIQGVLINEVREHVNCKLLFTNALDEMLNNNQMKVLFWKALISF